MTDRKLLFVRTMLTGAGLAMLAVSLATPAVLTARASDGTAVAAAEQGRGAAPRPSGRGPGPSSLGWEWWNDADVQKELGLSAEKIKAIDEFYARRNADLRPMVHDFLKQQQELDKMTRERVVDPSTYSLQVVRVESVRARLMESRMVMLYRMFRELTPEQHLKLQAMFDRRYNRRPAGAK